MHTDPSVKVMSNTSGADERAIVEHDAKLIMYLLYTTIAWSLFLVDVYLISSKVITQAYDPGSYGIIYFFKQRADSQNTSINILFWFSIIVLIHAYRIFFGTYFIKNDPSFVASREKVFARLDESTVHKRQNFDSLTIMTQIFLLGLLAVAIKTKWSLFFCSIFLVQTSLIIYYNYVNRDVFKADEQKFANLSIVLLDFVMFMLSVIFIIYVCGFFDSYLDIIHLNSIVSHLLIWVIAISCIEYLLSYHNSVKGSFKNFTKLVSATLK